MRETLLRRTQDGKEPGFKSKSIVHIYEAMNFKYNNDYISLIYMLKRLLEKDGLQYF